MSVKQHVNDDEKEIHELPEIATLPEGMMVAVDSERTGTKSFNLTAALEEKVDSPATAPTTGQLLMFNGTDNVWSDPPEGVYILNYTEVSDLNDIDINRVKTQPTFMKVDTDITVTIPTSGSPYTVSVQQGTLMAIDEIGSEGTTGSYTGPRFISFYCNNGNSVSGGIMQNAVLKVLCMVSLSPFGGVTKAWGATGFLNNDGALLRTMPAPVTFKCTNSRGPGADSVTTNHALKVEIQSYGSIRTQSLLPSDIETHDFSNDETPEPIQFMGWGATSNRAGYKTLITAKHNYDSTNFPLQTPEVQFLKFKMSGGTPESDQVMNVVHAIMKSSDGQNTEVIGGILVPTLGTVGALQYWSDSKGGHYGWKPVNELPASTAQDEGKILTVDSTGSASFKQLIKSHDLVDSTTYPDQTPEVQFSRVVGGNLSNYDADQIYTHVSAGVKSADGQSTLNYQGMLAPTRLPESRIGYLTCWSDSKGSHFAWKPPISNIGALTDAATITTTMLNNGFATLSTSQSNLTIVDEVYDANEVVNFCIEITPSVNCTLTIKKLVHGQSSSVALKHSVAGGNTLEANKTYQVTAVGNCWTLAEFED